MVSKISEWKPLLRLPSMQELQRCVRVSETQHQLSELQQELSRAKEELVQMRKLNGESLQLESQLLKATESEKSMLEAMVAQTKQLEQTKISLEESKLEVRNLQESIRKIEGLTSKNGSLESVTQEEMRKLRKELRLALEAEEKSKRAMDSFAVTVIELTAESKKAKTELAVTRAELEKAKGEALNANSLLNSTEQKLLEALDAYDRIKWEYEDSAAVWKSKEEGFLSCMKASEEEITKEKQGNSRLNDAWKAAREENSRLRDTIKHNVDEATKVKEALEITHSENSKLNQQLVEKGNALQQLRYDFESLKVSEAAALDSVRELKGFLASATSVESRKNSKPPIPVAESVGTSKPQIPEARKWTRRLSFERKRDSHQVRSRHSVCDPRLLDGSTYAFGGSIRYKNRMFSSISNVPDVRVPSTVSVDERRDVSSNRYDCLEVTGFDETENHKKKKTVLERIGDALRRRSFHR